MANAINANLLFKWRRQQRGDATSLCNLHLATPTVLLPVHVTPDDEARRVGAELQPASTAAAKPRRSGFIELEIAGAQLRLRGTVDEASLCSVLRALRQTA